MKVTHPDYQSHSVFAELEGYETFYGSLADSVFLWVPQGVKGAIGNLDSYLYSSIKGTLASVRVILKDGRINDAYALVRKYHDSSVINIYTNLYLKAEFSLDNFIVKEIDGWVKGRVQLPEYRVMSQYIRSSPEVAKLNDLFFGDDRYRRLRSRCNGHTHYNFYAHVLLNDRDVCIGERKRALEQLAVDLLDLFVFHVSYLFFINQHYMMSSDFVDCKDAGFEPAPGSQYWVAPFVQKVFDGVLVKRRPDVVDVIRESTDMRLL